MTGVTTRKLVVPKITTSVLGIGFNVAGAYALGLAGVVFANLVFSCVYCIWILGLAHKLKMKAGLVNGVPARFS